MGLGGYLAECGARVGLQVLLYRFHVNGFWSISISNGSIKLKVERFVYNYVPYSHILPIHLLNATIPARNSTNTQPPYPKVSTPKEVCDSHGDSSTWP